MKRRSRSSPPSTKRTFTEPGTPGPFTADIARDRLQEHFPGASPASVKKSATLRKQLFNKSPMVNTRTGASTSTMDHNSSSDSSGVGAVNQRTPPDQILHNIIDEAPRAPREPSDRNPPDIQDVVTQQTEILEEMLAQLRARQAAPVVQQQAAEPAPDPNFDWIRLALPAETSFQVPGDGQVQRMATSLFA